MFYFSLSLLLCLTSKWSNNFDHLFDPCLTSFVLTGSTLTTCLTPCLTSFVLTGSSLTTCLTACLTSFVLTGCFDRCLRLWDVRQPGAAQIVRALQVRQ